MLLIANEMCWLWSSRSPLSSALEVASVVGVVLVGFVFTGVLLEVLHVLIQAVHCCRRRLAIVGSLSANSTDDS